MTTMTAQLPLPVTPAPGVAMGLAACLVEDADGGRVFINGQLRPGQQLLDTETKLLTHAIRIAAFNTKPRWPEPSPHQQAPKPGTRPMPWSAPP